MQRFSLILTTALLLCSSASAQPNVLLPNELHWFTRGMSSEPKDKQGLAELLALDAKRKTDQPWLAELLVVGWAGFGDADMKDVARMTQLTHLWLRQSRHAPFEVTAAGWRELGRLQNLRVLGVSDALLDDDACAEIGKLTNLTTIYLHCKGSNVGVKKLMKLKKLVHVSLVVQGATPGDDLAEDLAGLTELRDLGIAHATISDAGVKKLAALPKLRSLGIRSANLTDAGLLEVAAMKSMVAVNFASSKVTQDGIDELWKKRPDLLMVNDAGKPPGPDSPIIMPFDFFGPYGGMASPDNDKELAALFDRQPKLRRLSIGWLGLNGAVMKDVAAFQSLTHLYVNEALLSGDAALKAKMTAKDWSRLAELPRLHMLAVNRIPLDADACAEIAKATELRTLRLIRTETGEGIARLGNLKKLTGLELTGLKLNDAGLSKLAVFENLHYLSLAENQISDDGLKRLADYPRLHHVNLDVNKITDAGLKHLAGIKRLAHVSLRATAISDDGLKVLAAIKTLRSVDLPMDKITPRGIAWFAKARPDVQYLPPPQPIEMPFFRN